VGSFWPLNAIANADSNSTAVTTLKVRNIVSMSYSSDEVVKFISCGLLTGSA
jgi:hypothetical protein